MGKKIDKKVQQKRKLVSVYDDTINYVNLQEIDVASTILYDLPLEGIPKGEELKEIIGDENEKVKIYVLNMDTLEAAALIPDESVMILNMASDFCPGGGVRKGSMAQEEEIFRRSTAFLSHPRECYPLKEDEVIYSPEIIILKDRKYKYLRDQQRVACLAVPALRKPRLIRDKFYEEDREVTRTKIEGIFQIAIKHNHHSLVLGALGCGAFQNPPFEIAALFREMVDLYGSYFKTIIFAVLVCKPTDQVNLRAFEQLFPEALKVFPVVQKENNYFPNEVD